MSEQDFVIPDGIGRNDPCPCGSGKKYKKCHFSTHRVEKEAAKTTVSVEGLINSKSSPWDLYKILTMVNETNVANLLWEMAHDESPFRERYPTAPSYLSEITTGVLRLPAGKDFDLVYIRHDGPDVKLLITQGYDEPNRQSVRAEIVTLRPNQIDANRELRKVNYHGYRVWNIEYATAPKSEMTDGPTFQDFGVEWAPKWDAPEGWFAPIAEFTSSTSEVSPAVTSFAST